jgi:hypothetical protein
MKNSTILISILITILSVLWSTQLKAQSISNPLITLKDSKGKAVPFRDIITEQENTFVVFWNSSNKKHMDFLEMLDEREMEITSETDVHLVAICTDKYHNYQQLQALSASKNWDISIYLDINESFKRINNISDEHLRTILYVNGEETPDPIALPDMGHRNYLITENTGSENLSPQMLLQAVWFSH